MTERMKQKLLNGLAWAAVVSFSTFIIYNMEVPPPKIYKDGYEVVKIGGCTYLRDWGMFHETLVHDGECKNHQK